MDRRKTVNINGRQYDMLTGLPLDEMPDQTQAQAAPAKATPAIPRSIHAGNIHSVTQKSQTLRRSALQRPAATQAVQPAAPSHIVQLRKKAAAMHQQPIIKSPQINRFAPRAISSQHRVMDIGPAPHPIAVKAQAAVNAKKMPAETKPVQTIKEAIMQEAIANTTKQTKQHKRSFRPRIASIVTASFALFILGGYLTYLNMPSLSVRVAAAAAGIDASYPNYRPDGYQLSGPVVYDKGQVRLDFAANAGPQNFTIKQTKSDWDSAAVLDKYVDPKAGSDYATYSERGLTIYTFDGGVAWVNGGILYTIEGNAPLSNEQVRRLATSFI